MKKAPEALVLAAIGTLLSVPALSQNYPLTYAGAFAVPGTSAASPFKSWDQIYIDPLLQIGALSSRSSKAITLFNAYTGQPFGSTAPVFTGNGSNVENSGPNGLVIAGTQIWAGDYPHTVRVFDLTKNLTSPPQVATIDTTGTSRADSLDYDPFDRTVIETNSDVAPAFVNLISTRTYKIRKQITFDGTGGTPDATGGGLGGVLFDYVLNRFVVSVTTVGGDATKGAVSIINPSSGAVERTIYGIDNCQPSSLAEGPGANVLVGCDPGFPAPDPVVFAPRTYIVNAQTGTIVANITQVGGADYVAYNLRDNRYYTASRDYFTSPSATSASPVLGIIDAGTNQWIANIPTAPNAHSVAVNPLTNQVFVPIANPSPYCNGLPGCIVAAQSH